MKQAQALAKVFVIVLNWNQAALTAACVRSLLGLDSPAYRIVVVDNGSRDGSVEKLKQEFEDRIEVIGVPSNLGFAAGNNVGIRHAMEQAADYVMLLNNDTAVDRCCLGLLMHALEGHAEIAAAVPKIYYMDRPATIWAAGGQIRPWLGQASGRGRDRPDRGQFDQAAPVDYGSGCCLLVSRAALEAVGLLNEAYFAYFEDTDWCMRARGRGMQIWYVPDSKVWHVAGAATTSAKGKKSEGHSAPLVYYLVTRNNLWFIRRHLSGLQQAVGLAAFAARHLLFYSLAFACLGRWQKLAGLWRGARDGLFCRDNAGNQCGRVTGGNSGRS